MGSRTFRFKLEALLEVRLAAKEAAERALAQAIEAGRVASARLDQIREMKSQRMQQVRGTLDELARPTDGPVRDQRLCQVRVLERQREQVRRAEMAESQQVRQVAIAERLVEARRHELARAHADARALERLREEQHAAWRRAQSKKEERDNDEAGAIGWITRQTQQDQAHEH